ncbi:N-acetylmannosamine-6-phosphate 2-epimerase [Bacillus sp. JJ1562]|uniref:N-acetylmannosamine-6-phosphate 2-epimerase n=1 Tax=Bacillus sp. JJ1562 TaxID=3122960 RepID=UPI00300110B8
MKKEEFFKLIKNELIVSCQAYSGEPLFGSNIMAKMSLAAKKGGAVAIRANGKEDIIAIRKETGLPTLGIVKREYEDSDVYITPTLKEVQELIESGTEVIALDATRQVRPSNVLLEELITYIRTNSNCLIMGDISTASEGEYAIEVGCDFISTTLSGYTPYSRQQKETDFKLIEELASNPNLVVVAEGRITTPKEAKRAIKCGAHSVVVGTSITRPTLITKNFVDEIRTVSLESI